MNFERPDKIALDFKTAHTHSMCLKEGNFAFIVVNVPEGARAYIDVRNATEWASIRELET